MRIPQWLRWAALALFSASILATVAAASYAAGQRTTYNSGIDDGIRWEALDNYYFSGCIDEAKLTYTLTGGKNWEDGPSDAAIPTCRAQVSQQYGGPPQR